MKIHRVSSPIRIDRTQRFHFWQITGKEAASTKVSNKTKIALTLSLSWLEHHPTHHKVVGLSPRWGA